MAEIVALVPHRYSYVLQVSLGKMTIDIYKYIIVFAIIISAFAAGLARFYQYYDGMVYEDEFGMKTVQVQ